MTVDELKNLCAEKIANPIADGMVSLMISGRAHGNTKRFPGLGIRGEIVCEYDDACLCAFDAKKILAALDKSEAE